MPAKKTIAIVGATEKKGTEIVSQLAQADCRLLLISNDAGKLDLLEKSIEELHGTNTEMDFIECAKDGCWEADIIILSVPFIDEREVAEMIKEVATQKIVAVISNNKSEVQSWQQLLPYSKLVMVSEVLPLKEVSIEGNYEEANKEMAIIFENVGFHAEIRKIELY